MQKAVIKVLHITCVKKIKIIQSFFRNYHVVSCKVYGKPLDSKLNCDQDLNVVEKSLFLKT